MHYYSHYRNYVQRTTAGIRSPMARAWPADIVGPASSRVAPGSTVQLNKSATNRVINYARDLSASIVGLKDSAKMFLYDMHLIERGGAITFDSHLQWVEEDLQNFIATYNNIQHIDQLYGHSAELTHFAHYMRNFTQESSQILSHLGVITYDQHSLTYHGMATTASKETARRAVDTFKSTYNAARDFLNHPLAQHMEFKGLNYYYNYTIGSASDATFELIGSGTLLDVAV